MSELASGTLDQYKTGASGVVRSVSDHALSTKLMEMGIYAGQKIKVLYKAPLGDPIAIQVSGYVLSLRLNEASLVEMEEQ